MDRILLPQGSKDSSVVTTKFSRAHGIHMIDLRRMEGSFDLEATHRL